MRRWLLVLALASLPCAARADDFFEAKIRPVLSEACFKCHGAKKVSGGLRVDSRAALLKGGDSGPALVPGDPAASLLLKAMRQEEGVSPMPPKSPRDRSREEAFAAWIKRGAPWPAAGPAFKGERHWAFQPLAKDAGGTIDGFLAAGLKKKGYAPLGPAGRRALLRRAAFDLTGLPPAADEVAAFAKDTSRDAFPRAVERLLASPHYGERWGRHWLDVARYADSAGENSDHPLPHAWRYRNWVIDAFNDDKPYDEFVKEQVAGDLMAKDGSPAKAGPRIVATGFLAIARRFGHDIDKDMHLTLEDALDTTGKAFLGLSIGCARCHTHKYDPITAEDYYALYGILSSTRFAFPGCEPVQQPRDLVPLPGSAADPGPIRARLAGVEAGLNRLADEQQAVARAREAAAGAVLAKGEIPDGGMAAFAAPGAAKVKTGEMVLLFVEPLRNHGADSTLVEFTIREEGGGKGKWSLADVLDGFAEGNPHGPWHFLDGRDLRPLPEILKDHAGHKGLHVWRNGDTPSVFVNASKAPVAAWTKLAARSVFLHPATNGPVAVGWLSPIDGSVSIAGRVKDAHPGGPDGVGWRVQVYPAGLASSAAAAGRAAKVRSLTAERDALAARLAAVPVAYAVAEGTAKDAPVHLRGDPEKPGKTVPRRWLSAFGGEAVAGKESGRRELAGWLAGHPLAARVMANRVWQHHFGKGLVKTPNDFGARGAPPTHPELLESLAAGFVRSGWSVKALHRRILLSDAYQRASAGARIDADPANDSYWRFDPRRLSAEELRDALLVAGGNLDRSPGGPHPFPTQATWNFSQHNPFSAVYETDRRSVYLMSLRNRRHPFLGLFDGADPNSSTADRQPTTVPTQALYFMNDPFFHRQADRFAGRVLAKPSSERIAEAYRIALQREASGQETSRAGRFVNAYLKATNDERQAWAAFARVLLSSNEFLYQD